MTHKIKHHLSDSLLMAYSAGALPESFGLIVATHVSMCDECRARLGAFDMVGGALMEECGPVALSEGSLEATLALIGLDRGTADVQRRVTSLFPAPLHDYVGGDLASVKWRPVGMGVKQAILPTSDDATARLLYIPAGTMIPDHGHNGTELTLVLQGAFVDDGDHFGRGDVEGADEAVKHTPVAAPGEDCICLAATDAPLKFSGFMPRLAQPFLKI